MPRIKFIHAKQVDRFGEELFERVRVGSRPLTAGCLTVHLCGVLVFQRLLGEEEHDKVNGCVGLALQMGRLLSKNTSKYLSRDVPGSQPGAVRVGDYVVSFNGSGSSSTLDENFVVALCVALGWLSGEPAKDMLRKARGRELDGPDDYFIA